MRMALRRRETVEDFWAVRDVSLSIRRGESVGFCGSNGSGKTSLLKVISRILPPTWGRVTVRGRIAPFLELATGFHPLLTGRENIRLNASLMGLSDEEIREKTASIVEFAELGDFIDSPVKTYSAGMYMRLGFAICGHIDADIIVIDEILAVGDGAFQRKCLDWLDELRARGVTILVVSHILPLLRSMCDRMVWLDHGSLVAEGPADEILPRYDAVMAGDSSHEPPAPPPVGDAPGGPGDTETSPTGPATGADRPSED